MHMSTHHRARLRGLRSLYRLLTTGALAAWLGMAGLPAQAQVASGQRVALVIGNASYQNEATLNNPTNDARLIDKTLRTAPLSFSQVTHVSNANRVQLLSALSAFKRQAQGADVALVYYSGHGMINSKRQNHVLPVDMPKISANAGLDADTALDIHGVNEDKVLDALEGAKVQVAVLDACRDNGFGASKSGTKGLSRRADQARNRLVAYATEEGRTAEEGSGANSTYAASLAQHLVRTDWPLLKVFDEVASDVERITRGTQLPTRSGNLRTDVYLLASVGVVPTGQPVQVTASTAVPVGNELILLIKVNSDTWAEVTDDSNRVRVQRLLKAGEEQNFSGSASFSVVLGNAMAAQVLVRGQPLDLRARSRNNVARFDVQ